jgi:uncharacterized protein involved in exopolysaccharide biosynthesis
MSESQALSLTGVLTTVKQYGLELWRKKWWVVLSAMVLSGLMVTSAWFTPKKYVAPLTFMVDSEGGSSPGGAVSAMLGQFGLGATKGSGHNYDKLVELSLSRMILTDVLKTKTKVDDTIDFLGNHVLRTYTFELPRKSNMDETFWFRDDTTQPYVDDELQAILTLTKFIRGNPQKGVEGLIMVGYDDESTVVTIKAKTIKEELSTRMAEVEYDVLSKFYIYNTTKKQKTTYRQLSIKVDSIQGELRAAEAQFARFMDLSGIYLNQNKLPREQLARKIEVLYIMYGETLKNKETADFLLKNATPYFQVIDYPVGPYQPVGKSRMKSLIMGGILGGFLCIAFILGRFWFLEQLQKEKIQS